MLHVTLNTGLTHASPRTELHGSTLPIVLPLLEPGEHVLGWIGSSVHLKVPKCPAGWLGTVYDGDAPLVTIGVAATKVDADHIWRTLEALYFSIPDKSPFAAVDQQAAQRPSATPWVGVVVLGPMIVSVANMITGLERCIGWAYVETHHAAH